LIEINQYFFPCSTPSNFTNTSKVVVAKINVCGRGFTLELLLGKFFYTVIDKFYKTYDYR